MQRAAFSRHLLCVDCHVVRTQPQVPTGTQPRIRAPASSHFCCNCNMSLFAFRKGSEPAREGKALALTSAPGAGVTMELPQQPSQWLWFGRLAKALLNVHRIFICRLRFGLGCFFFSVQFDICIVAILRETLSPHHKQALGTGSPGCQRYFHSFLAFVLVLQPRLCSPSAGTCSPIGGKLLNTKMNKKETTNRKRKKKTFSAESTGVVFPLQALMVSVSNLCKV